jgi:DNA-binding MarR family transcriptional regulator
MSSQALGLGTLLRQLTAALDGGVQQVYNELGAEFRPRFFPVARFLLDSGTSGVSALAAELGSTQPAISQTLREMERCGLVAWSSGEDRRVRLVGLSPAGRDLCKRLEPVWKAAGKAVAGLDEDLGAELGAILRRAIEALERKPFDQRMKEQLK